MRPEAMCPACTEVQDVLRRATHAVASQQLQEVPLEVAKTMLQLYEARASALLLDSLIGRAPRHRWTYHGPKVAGLYATRWWYSSVSISRWTEPGAFRVTNRHLAERAFPVTPHRQWCGPFIIEDALEPMPDCAPTDGPK
jgi:hypothetical protein